MEEVFQPVFSAARSVVLPASRASVRLRLSSYPTRKCTDKRWMVTGMRIGQSKGISPLTETTGLYPVTRVREYGHTCHVRPVGLSLTEEYDGHLRLRADRACTKNYPMPRTNMSKQRIAEDRPVPNIPGTRTHDVAGNPCRDEGSVVKAKTVS